MTLSKPCYTAVVALAAMIVGTLESSAHPPLPAGCSSGNRPGCAYTPVVPFHNIDTFQTVLIDPARNNYRLPVLVRYPLGLPGPLPVIIYNHGGGASAHSGASSNAEPWPKLWAQHGYVVINPSRAPLKTVTPAQTAECGLNLVPPAGCAAFFGQHIYGPQNTDFLIGRFALLGTLHPPLNGLMDSTRVVVAGWSGGSTIALANSGAWRQFYQPNGPVYHQTSSLPIGFFGISTMGPDYAGYDGGFASESYDDIDERPFITMTGKGDTNGKPSEPRTTAWRRSKGGNKYISYDNMPTVQHGTVNLSQCNTAVRMVHCDWMKSAGLAFMDAVTRQDPNAINWLKSDAYEVLTKGAIELDRR